MRPSTVPPRATSPAGRLGLAAALVLLVSACAPWGDFQRHTGGMPHGDMPMGHMHGQAGAAADDQAPAPVDDADEVVIRATEMAFRPEELTVQAGTPINVTVVNDGEVVHDFALDPASVHLALDPGEQATAALRLDEPGTYEARCTVPGHAEAGMVMTIRVQAAAS